MAQAPKHWRDISWEEMARENPMFAIMTTESMEDAPPEGFSAGQLEVFFAKGEKLFRKLRGLLPKTPDAPGGRLVVEYGCGMGRILKAAHRDGNRVAGIDISATMIEHCRRLLPEAQELHVLDADGRSGMESEVASLVLSYAVVQHISSLSRYLTAFDEMCRILKPGGRLAVQVNCTDFMHEGLERPGRTENFEDHSLHWRPGEAEPYMRHEQNNWSGVYIGADRLTRFLAERRVSIYGWSYHDEKRPIGMWVHAKKKAA